MPTGGKLVGAIVFAMLAYWLSDLVKPLLPENKSAGLMSEFNALIGLVMGWKIMGKGAGETYRQTFGYGLTTVAATVFWCLTMWAGYEMLRQAIRKRFDGPMEALREMAQLFLDYGRLIAVQDIIWPAIVGGLFLAWVTHFFARRWS